MSSVSIQRFTPEGDYGPWETAHFKFAEPYAPLRWKGGSRQDIEITSAHLTTESGSDLSVLVYDKSFVTPKSGKPSNIFIDDGSQYAELVARAREIIDAQNNPVIFYFTQPTEFEGVSYRVGDDYTSTVVGHPAPPNTTTIKPPACDKVLAWNPETETWSCSSFQVSLNLDDTKAAAMTAARQDTQNFLAGSDWMLLRELEGGAVVPEDIYQARAKARRLHDERIGAIQAAKSPSEVEAVMADPQYTTGREYPAGFYIHTLTA